MRTTKGDISWRDLGKGYLDSCLFKKKPHWLIMASWVISLVDLQLLRIRGPEIQNFGAAQEYILTVQGANKRREEMVGFGASGIQLSKELKQNSTVKFLQGRVKGLVQLRLWHRLALILRQQEVSLVSSPPNRAAPGRRRKRARETAGSSWSRRARGRSSGVQEAAFAAHPPAAQARCGSRSSSSSSSGRARSRGASTARPAAATRVPSLPVSFACEEGKRRGEREAAAAATEKHIFWNGAYEQIST
ncbi:Hypothetical predicted protein [Podarcis lilfordi]|uniref:Uncharacterized protein n=1 Tax=Podarcis lilfordi TaxID=74358 RepID=A0AA35K3C9_9SAUR|nr:Hypothetical predicted protein [Podarcis lilfordi]